VDAEFIYYLTVAVAAAVILSEFYGKCTVSRFPYVFRSLISLD